MTFQLRPDQVQDLSFFMNHPLAVNGNDPGTGKTPVIAVNQRFRWDQHQAATIWAGPKTLLEKNRREAIRFGGWDPNEVVVVDGTPAQVQEQMQRPAKVFLMGPQRFRIVMEEGGFPERFTAFDADEFHKGFGGHESKQTGAMYQFMKTRGKFFLPMTGTIINGKLDTAYPAMQVIEPTYYGNFKAFQNFHHVVDMFTGKRIAFRNHEHLRAILGDHGTFRKWTDVFGPEMKVIQREDVEMEEEARRLYDKFEAEAMLELEKFYIDGTLPGVATIRARQLMEHPNRFPDLTDPGKFVDIIPGKRPGKIERLDLHLTNHAELDTPVVVFAALVPQQNEIYNLMKELGLVCGLINGETPRPERDRIDEAFRRGEIKALIVSPKVADVGFNWQFCGSQEVQHAIFASLDYQDTAFFQAYRRFMRETRSTALRITILEYVNSLDQKIRSIINRKFRDAHLVDPTRELISL